MWCGILLSHAWGLWRRLPFILLMGIPSSIDQKFGDTIQQRLIGLHPAEPKSLAPTKRLQTPMVLLEYLAVRIGDLHRIDIFPSISFQRLKPRWRKKLEL
jgi:hypothetical protein